MSTQAAATETAPTTVTTEKTGAPLIPEREEVLKAFAREAMGVMEPEAPTADADPENAPEALSQTQPEATAEAETPEAGAEETETEPENHLEDDLRAEIPAEVQEKINRRIGKEVAKTKAEREAREAAETRANQSEARIAELEAKAGETPARRPAPGLAHIHDDASLAAEKSKAEQALEQTEDLLLNLEDDPQNVEAALRAAKIELKDEHGEDDFSVARMRKFLRTVQTNADRTLRRAIPERQQFIKAADQAAAKAMELMPELKDAKSERAKIFQQVLRELPELQRDPNWPLKAVAGVKAMEWMKAELEAKAKPAAAAPKPKRETPVTIPAPRAQAPTVRTKAAAPNVDDFNAVADKVVNGDKSARLKFIQGFVTKS